MGKAFEQIAQGLREAEAFFRGEDIGAVVHIHPDAVLNVALIRKRTGLSQAEFARSIGVKKATLLNWEQARRRPEGPARVLLALIAKEPGIVGRVLGGWGLRQARLMGIWPEVRFQAIQEKAGLWRWWTCDRAPDYLEQPNTNQTF